MKTLTTSTDQAITLLHCIASSGEGEVWQTQFDDRLAKIYHHPTPARIAKLQVMIAHPPRDPNAKLSHISFAWPQALLHDASGRAVGFLMPKIADSVDLLGVYNPQQRQKVLPGFDWRYLHVTAANIASIVAAIHRAGYVIGDIKPQNILVNNRALPAIIDTDSFQVRDPVNGILYRCLVGSEGFTPPELLGKDLEYVEQTPEHDRFRLAVIIYLLLFGDYPFKGKWIGTGESPLPTELLRQGWWAYAPNSLIQPGLLTVPLKTVHPELRRYFLRCFNQGHRQPELRPTPTEWLQALKLAIAELQPCRKVRLHHYSHAYGKCYWCERKAKLGVDVFPAPPTAMQRLIKQQRAKIHAATQPLAVKLRRSRSKSSTLPQSITGSLFPASLPPISNSAQWQPYGATMQPPLQRSIDWGRVGTAAGAIAVIAATFGLLAFLSRSQMDTAEIQLTIVGIMLCLGLVGVGYFLLKVTEHQNF
ncbi:helix-hairpin-helix domain-containing protein [Pantanalinema rosaneae CENA516]|uniref:helix-hairpin-helix domain-containing protein n=1 Tax=Pantanalinema rosaneae TaxID=1620701 RepID=UPI003D6F1AF4